MIPKTKYSGDVSNLIDNHTIIHDNHTIIHDNHEKAQLQVFYVRIYCGTKYTSPKK